MVDAMIYHEMVHDDENLPYFAILCPCSAIAKLFCHTRTARMAIDPCTLIVNYVPTLVGNEDLAEIFEPFGKITLARVIYDRASGEHRGFGFVRYATEGPALAAMQALNGLQIENKRLKISFAYAGTGTQRPASPHVQVVATRPDSRHLTPAVAPLQTAASMQNLVYPFPYLPPFGGFPVPMMHPMTAMHTMPLVPPLGFALIPTPAPAPAPQPAAILSPRTEPMRVSAAARSTTKKVHLVPAPNSAQPQWA